MQPMTAPTQLPMNAPDRLLMTDGSRTSKTEQQVPGGEILAANRQPAGKRRIDRISPCDEDEGQAVRTARSAAASGRPGRGQLWGVRAGRSMLAASRGRRSLLRILEHPAAGF